MMEKKRERKERNDSAPAKTHSGQPSTTAVVPSRCCSVGSPDSLNSLAQYLDEPAVAATYILKFAGGRGINIIINKFSIKLVK